MSFINAQRRVTNSSGHDQLHWNRANVDGAPYRGSFVPLLKEEEFEQLAERNRDARAQMFNLSDPEQKEEYETVLTLIVAPWYELLYRDHIPGKDDDGNPCMYVYIEWAVPYMEISQSNMPAAINQHTLEQGTTHGNRSGFKSYPPGFLTQGKEG